MKGFRQVSSAAVLVALVFICTGSLHAADIPTPEQYFGHAMGAEGRIVDYLKSLEYYRMLAEKTDRVRYQEVGKTTDGNPFVIVTIASPAHLAHLDELRAMRNRLVDPRSLDEQEAQRIAAEMPAVVFHTGSIHSSEISCAQVPAEVIHRLATSDDAEVRFILDNVIVLYSPSANPDGQVKYNKWYADNVGKPWEGNLPEQYHTYVGHDDNRDWIMLELPESRLTVSNVFLKWHPVYSHEMHEMGATGARMFVPPYEDPSDANAAPEVVSAANSLGMAISNRLTTEGKGGVVMDALFDLYSPSRAFQAYHGTARILTETASGNFARTRVITAAEMERPDYGSAGSYNPLKPSWNFPLPWKPGPWSFRDRVEYQISANFALMRQAAANRAQYNMALYHAMQRAVQGEGWPYAYVISAQQHDSGAAQRLLRLLQFGGIELQRATASFAAGGVTYPAGSTVIVLRQPYAAWAKTLMETQQYPDLRHSPSDPPVMPYDVTGHTLPLLMGVSAERVEASFSANLQAVTEPVSLHGAVLGTGKVGYALLPADTDAYAVADNLLDAGIAVSRLLKPFKTGAVSLPAGAFILPASAADQLRKAAESRCFTAYALEALPAKGELAGLRNPRIAIYEPWGGLMDAGWTRLLFERFELEFTTLRNADIRAGNLNAKWDLIIFPNGISPQNLLNGARRLPEQYSGGIGEEGVTALKSYAENGGTLLSWGGSSMTVANLLDLPLKNAVEGVDNRLFFAPGNIVLAENDSGCPLNYGMPAKTAVQVRFSPVFVPAASTQESPKFVVRYPDYDPRLSGFLLGAEYMQGRGALAVGHVGAGRAILFSYLPQFRLMTAATYRQVFNAIFLASQN